MTEKRKPYSKLQGFMKLKYNFNMSEWHPKISTILFVLFIFGFITANNLWAISWPPSLGKQYPNLEFIDQNGDTVRISDFKGKLILIEYVGMSCSACQAFSGAHKTGSYKKIEPQRGLKSIEEYFPEFTGGLSLSDNRIMFIQILLYDLGMKSPTPEHSKNWAEHFGMDRGNNEIVLVSTDDLRGKASFNMIPGFQLVDKDFILRVDSTGHRPRHNLYTQLLPTIPKLIDK